MSEDTKVTTIPSPNNQIRQLEKFIKYLINKLGGGTDVIISDVDRIDMCNELVVDTSAQGVLHISLDSLGKDIDTSQSQSGDAVKFIDAQDSAMALQKLQYWDPESAN